MKAFARLRSFTIVFDDLLAKTYHPIRVLPGIVDFIGNGFFLARSNKDAELDGLAIGFDEVVGLLKNVPIYPAIEMFDDSEFDSVVFLMIAEFYFESLVQPVSVRIDLIMRSFSFAYEVESVARIDTNSFILRCMVDNVLAGEFQLAVIIPAIEPHNAAGQRDTEVIFLGVFELFHNPYLRIRLCPVFPVTADIVGGPATILPGINLGAVIDIQLLTAYTFGTQELDLLRLAVVERSRTV
jgi:hypothetical protein